MKENQHKKENPVQEDPHEVLKEIGLRLRKLRKERGYKNSDDFAYDHNINRSQYGKYEAGSVDMRVSSLTNIVNLFDLTLEEFFRKDF
jgi:transcriptional regulator with XRE-family HTH domain